MFQLILKAYRFLFARTFFYKFNRLLYRCGLSGLGVLNYENSNSSGERNFLEKILKKMEAPVIFDVGANVGNYTKTILDISPKSKIYMFEPHPKTYAILLRNLSSQESIVSNNLAVGSETSILKLYDYKNQPSSHASLYKEVIEDIHYAQSESYDVQVVTLDDFTLENSIEHIDLLKIDVEGHELNVVKGASRLLLESRISVIQFEFNEMNAVSHNFIRDFMSILPNFKFYRLLPNEFLPLTSYSPVMIEIFAYQNIIAVHNDFESLL